MIRRPGWRFVGTIAFIVLQVLLAAVLTASWSADRAAEEERVVAIQKAAKARATTDREVAAAISEVKKNRAVLAAICVKLECEL